MSPPDAQAGHFTAERLRIRIPSRKRNVRYFDHLRDEFLEYGKFDRVEVNPVTGSILFTGRGLKIASIEEYARSRGLFELRGQGRSVVPVTRKMIEPLGSLSSRLKRFTGGQIDLPGFIFILLLVSGLYEIVRGNFRAPPWYTALWYAFGVFTKSLADRSDDKGVA